MIANSDLFVSWIFPNMLYVSLQTSFRAQMILTMNITEAQKPGQQFLRI